MTLQAGGEEHELRPGMLRARRTGREAQARHAATSRRRVLALGAVPGKVYEVSAVHGAAGGAAGLDRHGPRHRSRVALVMGASKGIGRASGRGAGAARARAWRSRAARASGSRQPPPRSPRRPAARCAAFAADTDDARDAAGARRAGPRCARAGRDPGRQHGRAAAGRLRCLRPRAVGERLPQPGARADGPDRGGRPGDARARGWGRIVNVTSIATKEPIPGLMLSNSHRLAAVGRSRRCRGSWRRDGILLNSVAPGRIATDRIASMTGTSARGVALRAAARHPRRPARRARGVRRRDRVPVLGARVLRHRRQPAGRRRADPQRVRSSSPARPASLPPARRRAGALRLRCARTAVPRRAGGPRPRRDPPA